MRTSIDGRVVIQARTAEWQRQYRNNDWVPSALPVRSGSRVWLFAQRLAHEVGGVSRAKFVKTVKAVDFRGAW